jgi:hypothetical protein
VHQRAVHAQPAGHLVAGLLGVLGGAPQGDPAVLAPHRGRGPGLQRGRGQPLVDDLLGDHDLAAVEEVRVEVLLVVEPVGGVGAGVLEHQHLVGEGVAQVDHRRQRVVIDLHQLGGVLALVRVLGEHGGHRLPDEPHLAGRQPRPGHGVRYGREQLGRGQIDLVGGHDVHDAGGVAGRARVHPVIRAWAIGDRTNVRCRAPDSLSSVRSSVYVAPRVRKAGSSMRTTRVPMMLIRTGP